MGLSIVTARQVACFPWHLRICFDVPVRAAFCRSCQLDVALPVDRERDRPICIYCAMDSGLIPAVDVPFGLPAPTEGVGETPHPEGGQT